MGHTAGKKFKVFSALTFLLIFLFLFSCHHGDGDRLAFRPQVLQLTVGVPFADTVVQGGFNQYTVSATPGTVYKISMTGVADDADILYFGTDSSYTFATGCSVDNTALTGVTSEDCVVAAPGGALYFAVEGSFLAASAAFYTIAVEQVLLTDINLSLPVLDVIGRTQAVLYTLPAAAAGAYIAAITGLNNDADLHVFANSIAAPSACTTDNTRFTGSTPEDCRLNASGGSLLLLVDSVFSSSPTVLFTAFTAPAPAVGSPADEGLPGAPVALAIDTLRTGQAGFNGTSYYAASGLTAGSRYTVSVNGLTNGAELAVYNNDSSFSAQATCLIDNTLYTGTTPESCTVTAGGTSLYFTVTADTGSGGVAFITLVEPGP
jgi:hypothetical protein